MKNESITAKKKKIKALKAALAERRKQCEDCKMRGWGDCGYCAVPKWELLLAIERLEREVAA